MGQDEADDWEGGSVQLGRITGGAEGLTLDDYSSR